MGQNHNASSKLIIIGSVGAPFGVHGWVKINSYTEPKENILQFNNWILIDNQSQLNQINAPIIEIKQLHSKFIALFKNITDCNQASLLTNKQIAIPRESLPELPDNQYYWEDLVNCNVYNLSEQYLGVVDHLFSTAANDVVVVKNDINNKEYLIPYSLGDFIIDINLEKQIITVDWSTA